MESSCIFKTMQKRKKKSINFDYRNYLKNVSFYVVNKPSMFMFSFIYSKKKFKWNLNSLSYFQNLFNLS